MAELGLGKFVFAPGDKLVGIHILGNRAPELLHEAQLVKMLGVSFSKIANMIHIYPSYGDVVKRPAGQYYADRLRNHFVVKFVQKLASLGKY